MKVFTEFYEKQSAQLQGVNMNNKTFYRVWLQDEFFNTHPLFECVEEGSFETWLRENAVPTAEFGHVYWFIEHRFTAGIRDDIPYNSMGYLVKYEKI